MGKLTGTPQKESPGATHEEYSPNIATEPIGVRAGLYHKSIANVE